MTDEIEIQGSDKVSDFGKKPRIKKGYYPARLNDVKIYANKEGKPIEKQYGHMAILTFAVYEAGDEGEPIKRMTYKDGENSETIRDVELPQFIYYEYKNKNGEWNSALTPNSKLTKLLKNLGLKFEPGKLGEKKIKLSDFIGSWAELCIDDYEVTPKEGEPYKASTIKDVNKYEGPKPKLPGLKKEETLEVTEEVVGDSEKVIEIKNKMKEIKKYLKEGNLTQESYDELMEKFKAKLKVAK